MLTYERKTIDDLLLRAVLLDAQACYDLIAEKHNALSDSLSAAPLCNQSFYYDLRDYLYTSVKEMPEKLLKQNLHAGAFACHAFILDFSTRTIDEDIYSLVYACAAKAVKHKHFDAAEHYLMTYRDAAPASWNGKFLDFLKNARDSSLQQRQFDEAVAYNQRYFSFAAQQGIRINGTNLLKFNAIIEREKINSTRESGKSTKPFQIKCAPHNLEKAYEQKKYFVMLSCLAKKHGRAARPMRGILEDLSHFSLDTHDYKLTLRHMEGCGTQNSTSFFQEEDALHTCSHTALVALAASDEIAAKKILRLMMNNFTGTKNFDATALKATQQLMNLLR